MRFIKHVKTGIKYMLPMHGYFILRDVYSFGKDLPLFYRIRREYTNSGRIICLVKSINALLKPEKIILFFPNRPSFYHAIYKLCALSGYRLSINPLKKCHTIVWAHNETFADSDVLNSIRYPSKIVNSSCMNVGKVRVGSVFSDVFGYPLNVDPLNYVGKIVEKSVLNGTNYGRSLLAPLSKKDLREGHVYQKEIDNRSDVEGYMLVYRVPFYNGEIPVVYLKYRAFDHRFTGKYDKVEVKKPDDVFSGDELRKIMQMNKKMGIDYGECDVLRDNDGKIYVVDVNNNPGGPPRKMSHPQKIASAVLLITAFKNMIEKFSVKKAGGKLTAV